MPGAFTFGVSGPDLLPNEAALIREADPWGFILFARNAAPGPDAADRLRRLTGALRDAVGRDAPVMIDQEGGRVERLPVPPFSTWDPPLDHMARAADPEAAMRARAALIGAELRAVGIDVNCTPSADVATTGTHPFLRNRCYGTTPGAVAARARANAEGCLKGGVLPVVKHMPGHGRGTLDSHREPPRVPAPLDALRAVDFAPFAALADLPMAMTAHVVYEAIDPDRPGTVSAAVHRVIRDEIGFGGLVMSDDIAMDALPGGLAERCGAALAAGCDVVLHCNGIRADMEVVAATCPALGGAARARADAALAMRPAAAAVDSEALRADLAAASG